MAEERINYAIIDGPALTLHGFVRPTQDVDLLVTPEGLARFSERLVGRVYLPAFPEARKHFCDTITGVPVEIITTGEFPGDGRPKAIAFRDPASVSVKLTPSPPLSV